MARARIRGVIFPVPEAALEVQRRKSKNESAHLRASSRPCDRTIRSPCML